MAGAAPFDDRARPAREKGAQQVDVLRRDVRILLVVLGFEQPPREILQRRAAGAEVDDLPARAGLGHEAELERVEQAGADQRRLAGARGAQHREEAGRRQPVDHRVGAVLAAEEQVGFLAPEGAQAGIGRTLRLLVGHRRSSATICSTLSPVRPLLAIDLGETAGHGDLRFWRRRREQDGLHPRRRVAQPLDLAVAAQLRAHPGRVRLAVDQQQRVAIDQVGVEILGDVLGRSFEQRAGGDPVALVLERLEQLVGQLLVALVRIDEQELGLGRAVAALFLLGLLLGLGLFLFRGGVLAFDRLLDLLHELLKAHDQHVRAVEQPLVPMRDGRRVDVGAPPLQHRLSGGLGGVVLELGVALGLGRAFRQQVGRTVRAVGAEQLDEQPGLREVGVERFGEFGPALLVVAFRQDLRAELVEIGDDLVALVIEVVGDLGEQDGLAGERSLDVRPASATGRGSSAAALPSGAPAPAAAARICPD